MSMKKSDVVDMTIRSGYPNAGGQPDAGSASEVSSVDEGPAKGQVVPFPNGSDTMSAGGAKSVDTLVEKTGSVVKFPDASDTTSAGGVKDVDSFAC